MAIRCGRGWRPKLLKRAFYLSQPTREMFFWQWFSSLSQNKLIYCLYGGAWPPWHTDALRRLRVGECSKAKQMRHKNFQEFFGHLANQAATRFKQAAGFQHQCRAVQDLVTNLGRDSRERTNQTIRLSEPVGQSTEGDFSLGGTSGQTLQ